MLIINHKNSEKETKMGNELILPENYKQTYDKIVKMIETAKHKVFETANFQTVYLFWHIGQELKDNILNGQKAEYGKSIVKNMSKDLEFQYGRSYEKSSVFRMIQFYEEFPDFEKVATLSQQLTWSHFKELLPVNDELKRDFYAVLCKNEKWSVRVLRERKKSMLYERTAISKRPEETIRNDIQLLEEKDMMTVDMFYRDPCILDFLGLQDTYSEKDLENAILAELEKFILEMGTDFAFMARQKKVTIDGKDYKIDLLFFHRKLKRLVVVELKIGEFEPEYKAQVELYLRWLNKYERMENEEAPVALILCAEKSDEVIELLELDKGDIRVAQYLTAMPPKEELEEKLRLAIQRAKIQLEQRKE